MEDENGQNVFSPQKIPGKHQSEKNELEKDDIRVKASNYVLQLHYNH